MNALIILIPVTLVLVSFAVGLFFWAVHHDQFRDLDTPEILPLLDDESGEAPFDASSDEAAESSHPKEVSP